MSHDDSVVSAAVSPTSGDMMLSVASCDEVLLATDLHAANVLRAQREPWLVIDPKPFIGDRAYDATQHLLNCKGRLSSAPDTTIRVFADLLEVDHERVRSWTFARLAAEPRIDWNDESTALAIASTCRTSLETESSSWSDGDATSLA